MNIKSQIAGKNIAVIAEQGVGDEIMFASMLPDIVARCEFDHVSARSAIDRDLLKKFSDCKVRFPAAAERYSFAEI